jgi:hypothetical protein
MFTRSAELHTDDGVDKCVGEECDLDDRPCSPAKKTKTVRRIKSVPFPPSAPVPAIALAPAPAAVVKPAKAKKANNTKAAPAPVEVAKVAPAKVVSKKKKDKSVAVVKSKEVAVVPAAVVAPAKKPRTSDRSGALTGMYASFALT